ncbi:cysteine-rich repeat secretory protein 38-like protein [Trifolium pratense]|uniref:Cysteine-rich repeat secretory protein 38-like protein n=1 Tax=Trifolium pratense TaxID=57577 RepID=A0A2K3KYG2_TRIPR|nr:cysteine-rich repeat secretory protein 38-like protein [Trifolium pratense]
MVLYYVEGTYLLAYNCSVCALNSTRVALDGTFPKYRDVTIWFRWCFLRYSNDSFFGEILQGSAVSTATANHPDIDDPSLVLQGIPFMSGVAATASVNSFMFHTEVLNFNQSEKRYGMAQCTRDISRQDCRRCLDGQLDTFRTLLGGLLLAEA